MLYVFLFKQQQQQQQNNQKPYTLTHVLEEHWIQTLAPPLTSCVIWPPNLSVPQFPHQ